MGTNDGISPEFSRGEKDVPDPSLGIPADAAEDVIISIDHITKVFSNHQTVTAVSDVSFNVRRGEIFGLLGPNGAGKSTLIRILTTLMKPTSGTAHVGSFRIIEDDEKVRGIIGVCPQNSTLDLELTAYDNLDFYGRLLDVDEDLLDKRIWELLGMAGLSDRAYATAGTFSGGMRRKLEIVRAFLHHPLILFLDEPTIGLDPDARREVWRQISLLNTEQTTIILTTHYMDEAEKLCDRIAFMDRGRLITLDTPENLKKAMPGGDLLEIGIDGPAGPALPLLQRYTSINRVEVKDSLLVISSNQGNSVLPQILNDLESLSMRVTSISIRSPSLEDVFIYLTGKGLEESVPGEIRAKGGH
ncbi:MAG: ATP-binding cassette domain-containing protein [Methanoregulaceae archaeon]|nr:ATP-binding cassette domain-containing protein [Methanoregulaceae archaeon]